MKIYYYDPETGIYQGEGYEDNRLLSKRKSNRNGMTTVAPPSFEKGRIPVFDSRKATWSVVSISETPSLTGSVRNRQSCGTDNVPSGCRPDFFFWQES